MTSLSRNAQVLRHLLETAPGVGRIKLIKFAYLADCEAYRYLGRPITGFKYRRDNHGPFDKAFYAAKDELVEQRLITEQQTLVGPYEGYIYRPTSHGVEYDFATAEVAILQYVAQTYLSRTATDLCDDVVYQTPPMRVAKVGERLDMDKMKPRKPDPLGFSLERMLAGEASAEAGRYQPLREAMDELRARLNS